MVVPSTSRCANALVQIMTLFLLSSSMSVADGYQILHQKANNNIYQNSRRINDVSRRNSRRNWLVSAITLGASSFLSPFTCSAAAAPPKQDPSTTINSIRAAKTTLQTLLDNWEKAVVECIYADVPRELLEQKNKEQLLEKAKTSALFDKSGSVVTCKTNNKNIRDYIGRTGIGPVVGLDKQLRRALELVDDPDDLERFVQASETVQQALSRADSYSYTAGGDYDAINNFEKEKTVEILQKNGNLKQVQSSVQTAIDGLAEILKIIDKPYV